MREFTCKAKSKEDDNEWVYGYVDETMYHDITVIHTDYSTIEVYRDTVCFSTGMCDKEGSMIYEGDIIGYEGKAVEYVVFYNKAMAAYFVMNLKTEEICYLCLIDKECTIIGNIYD